MENYNGKIKSNNTNQGDEIMITEKEKVFRQGYIAACEWFLEQKPTRTQVKGKVNWNKKMLEE